MRPVLVPEPEDHRVAVVVRVGVDDPTVRTSPPRPSTGVSGALSRWRGGVGESVREGVTSLPRVGNSPSMDLEEAARLLIDEYSRMARVYDVQAAPHHAPLVRRVLELAELEPGMSVIDVGCGTGNLAFEAVERVGPRGLVTGIDAALGAIRVATEKAEHRRD